MSSVLKNKKRNISCCEARELMFDYLEGELPARERERMSRHLDECAECRREFEVRRKLLDTIRHIELDAPSELYPNVMRLVDLTPQDKKSRFSSRRKFIPLGTIAAACAVFAFVLLNRDVIDNLQNADAAVYDIEGAKYYSVMEEDDALMKSMPTDGVDGVAPETYLQENGTAAEDDIVPEITRDANEAAPAEQAEEAEDAGSANLTIDSTTTLSAKLECGTLTMYSGYEEITHAYEVLATDLTSHGQAVLFCSQDALWGVLPTEAVTDYSCVAEDIADEYGAVIYKMVYDNKQTAAEEYTQYLTLLEANDCFYESYVPESADFVECYYVLVETGDNGE